MTTSIKFKLNMTDGQTNIDKYRVTIAHLIFQYNSINYSKVTNALLWTYLDLKNLLERYSTFNVHYAKW